MQKKLLVSLLVGPLAINAMADINMDNLDPAKWDVAGLVGDQYKNDNGLIEAAVGSGTLTQTLTGLPKGNYKITFKSGQNFKVLIDDKETTEFSLSAEGSVTVKIVAENPALGFQFDGAQLVLVFDFEGLQEKYTKSLGDTVLKDVVEGDTSDKAKELAKQKEELEKTKASIESDIAALSDESLEVYKKYNLADTPNAIEAAIDEYNKSVKEYNAQVDAENDLYNTIEGNKAAKDALLAEVTDLQAALDAAKENVANTLKEVTGDNKDAIVDYVTGLCTPIVTAIQGQIDAYEKAINDAYADLSKKDIKVESQKEDILKAITEYTTDADEFLADANAYYAIAALKDELKTAYEYASTILYSIQGIENYSTIFNEKVSAWQASMTEAYTEANTTLAGVSEIEGAAEKLAGCQEAVATAQEVFNQAPEYKALVKAQNDLMTAALEKIADAQAKIDVLAKNSYTAADAAEQQKALDKVLADVEKAYEDLALTEDSTSGLDAINSVVDDLTTAVQPIIDIQKKYDEIKAQVEELIAGTKELDGKFDETFDSIQEGIDQLNPKDNNDTTQLSEALDNALDNAKKLVEIFKQAKEALAAYTTGLEELDALIAAKTIVPGSKFSKEDYVKADPYKALKDAVDKFKADLKAAATLPSQKCYDKAVALNAEMEGYTGPTVASVTLDFETKATEANLAAAESLLATVKTAQATGEYFGKDNVSFAAIDADLAKIADDIAAAIAADPFDASKFNACDAEVEKAIEKINGLKSTIDILKGLDKTFTGIEDGIAAATTKNNETSWDEAKEYYDGVINTNKDSYAAQLGELKDKVLTALKDGVIDSDEQASLEKAASSLLDTVGKVPGQIQANQDAYQWLLDYAEGTRDVVQSAIDALEEKINSGNLEGIEKVDEWQNKLNDLLNQLLDLNRKVAGNYSKGESDSTKAASKAEYDDIRDAVKVVNDDINADLDDLVAIANSSWIDRWESMYGDLYNKYVAAVAAFNNYNDLTNANFRAVIQEKIGTHEVIYQYSALITELDVKVRGGISDATKGDKVLTQDDFDALVANTYEEEMAQIVTDMKANATAAAQKYYDDQVAEKQALIDAADSTMEAAGIESEIRTAALKAAQGYVDDAVKLYNSVKDTTEDIVWDVDKIANTLDKVPKSIDMEKAAKDQWTKTYNADVKELDALDTKVKSYNKVPGDDPNFEKFADAQQNVNDMAETADITKLLDVLKDKLERLEKYMQDARDAEKALRKKNQDILDTDATLKDFNDQIEKLRESLADLEKFADGIAGNLQSGTTDNISDAIDAIEDKVDASKNITADKDEIQGDIDAVENDIENGYTTIVAAENKVLEDLLSKIRVAFNNAVEAGNYVDSITESGEKILDEAGKAKNEEIDTLAEKVAALYDANKDEVKDVAAYKSDAQSYEKQAATLLNELQAMVDPKNTDLTGMLADLDTKYDELSGKIVKGQEELGDLVKEDYEAKYNALQDALDKVKEAYTGAGNLVLIYKQDYVNRMNEIADELDNLNAEAAAAQAKAEADKAAKEASQKRYDELTSELKQAQDGLNALKTTTASYEYGLSGKYEYSFNVIQNNLEVITKYITDEYNGDGISKDEYETFSSLIADYVNDRVDYYSYNIADDYERLVETDVNNTVGDAWNALANHVLDVVDFKKQLNGFSVDIENAKNALNEDLSKAETIAEMVEAYEKAATTLKGIKDDINALIAQIEDNTYVPGDINLDPDGEVNVIDLQILVNWVGEGMTYDEVKAQSPRQAAAADLNDDQKLNILDITALIRLIIDEQNGNSGVRYAMPRKLATGEVSLSLASQGVVNDGVRRYAVQLNNNMSLCAGQMDIVLPAGCELVDVTLSGRAQDHDIYRFDNANGARVIIASMTNDAFNGSNGDFMYIDVRGNGTPTIEAAIFSDSQSKGYEVTSNGLSLIESIYEGAREVKETIYNVAGQTMRAIKRGINIIRHSDGSVTKEVKK